MPKSSYPSATKASGATATLGAVGTGALAVKGLLAAKTAMVVVAVGAVSTGAVWAGHSYLTARADNVSALERSGVAERPYTYLAGADLRTSSSCGAAAW